MRDWLRTEVHGNVEPLRPVDAIAAVCAPLFGGDDLEDVVVLEGLVDAELAVDLLELEGIGAGDVDDLDGVHLGRRKERAPDSRGAA